VARYRLAARAPARDGPHQAVVTLHAVEQGAVPIVSQLSSVFLKKEQEKSFLFVAILYANSWKELLDFHFCFFFVFLHPSAPYPFTIFSGLW
jgi:hypothetical protein